MVSKYRDILDPDMLQKMTIGSMSSDELEKRLESIEKGSRAQENNHEDTKKTSLPSDIAPSSGAGDDGDTEEKKPSENNVDEVESLRQMLAGLTGTKYEKVENIGDRKMNQISSVRFSKKLILVRFEPRIFSSEPIDKSYFEIFCQLEQHLDHLAMNLSPKSRRHQIKKFQCRAPCPNPNIWTNRMSANRTVVIVRRLHFLFLTN